MRTISIIIPDGLYKHVYIYPIMFSTWETLHEYPFFKQVCIATRLFSTNNPQWHQAGGGGQLSEMGEWPKGYCPSGCVTTGTFLISLSVFVPTEWKWKHFSKTNIQFNLPVKPDTKKRKSFSGKKKKRKKKTRKFLPCFLHWKGLWNSLIGLKFRETTNKGTQTECGCWLH